MFKLAEQDDLPSCLSMCKSFAAFYGIKYNEKSILSILEKAVENGVVIILYANNIPVGIAAAINVPNLWDSDQMFFQELLWWVEEKYRNTSLGLKLLFELESYAPAGSTIAMSILPQSNIKESTMSKLGYSLREMAFMKG